MLAEKGKRSSIMCTGIKIIIALAGSLIFSFATRAEQINACHCFKNRSFDAASPGQVDPYLLATTQNSFLAGVFGTDKKEIVRAKMKGISGDDLWIAHFAAAGTGADAEKLLIDRSVVGAWKEVFSKAGVQPAQLGGRFSKALKGGAADETLSAIIVDQMVRDRLGAEKAVVEKLRKKGAGSKEVILAVFLSGRSSRSAIDYYADVKKGRSTWGSHLNALGIEAGRMKMELDKMIIQPAP